MSWYRCRMENEVWRPIPSIPGGAASSFGRVWFPSKKSTPLPGGGFRDYHTRPVWGSEEKSSTGREGSPKRRICTWRGKTYKVHRLVCEAFHGPAPTPSAIVLHLDEDSSNNRPDNIRWGTRKENQNFPKVKAAFRARLGEKSPLAIYAARIAADPDYRPKNRRTP